MPIKDSNKNEQGSSYRGVEYRLCPGTQGKAKKLAGACRFAWNAILAECQKEYDAVRDTDQPKPSVSFFSLGKRFTKLRQSTEWLDQYSCAIVRYTLKYQADAWNGFFKGQRGHPRFHSRSAHTDSFTATQEAFKIEGDNVHIQKIGWMKFRRKGGNPYLDREPIAIMVKKVGRYWSMSVMYKIPTPEKILNGITVGVDLNTYNVAWTDTTNEQGMLPIEKPNKKEIRIKRYQRKLAQQHKDSKRSKVTSRKIAKWKRKHSRKNRDHHNSRVLANRAEVLVREDLKLRNMTRSAKGTVEPSGKNMKAKAGLNRVMRNASHGRFHTYCEYKFSKVITVDPKYTSQRCSKCGRVAKENRLTQSKFKCVACGYADLNASANILASGIGATGRGGAFRSGTPKSRQMDRSVAK